MGYTTEFSGKVTILPTLAPADLEKLRQVADADQRDPGPGQVPNAPGYFCQWEPSADGSSLSWDGNEKFYDSAEWMSYLVTALAAKGYECNGTIEAQGEEGSDKWRLSVVSNVVSVQQAKISYAAPAQPETARLSATKLLG